VSRRGFLALCLVTLAAVAGAAALELVRSPADRPTLAGERVFPALADKLDQVARIAVVTPEARFTLARAEDGEGWISPSAGGYPVRAARVNALLVALSELELIAPRTARPALYHRLGVGPPGTPDSQSRRLTLRDAEGTVLADLIVGKQRHRRTGRRDRGTYIRRPDADRAYLAAGLVDLSDRVYPWLDSLLLDLDPARVRRVEIRRPDGGRLLAVRPGEGVPAMGLADLPAGARPDVAAVRALPKLLEGLRFEAVRRRPAVALPPPQSVAEVTTFDGLRVTARVHRLDGAYWLTLDAEATSAAGAAVRAEAERLSRRGPGWAYRVADYVGERLSQSLDDLLRPK